MGRLSCVLHGSFNKHFAEIKRVHQLFTASGIEVLAPASTELVNTVKGFALLEGQQDQDPRLIELNYLHHLKQLGPAGFSYFVNPEGYIGRSVSYELGIAQVTNVPCFFMHRPVDHPVYFPSNSVWSPQRLIKYVRWAQQLPQPSARPNERRIHELWHKLMVPGSIVATGAMIEYQGPRSSRQWREVLMVKTYKWGNRWSIVGGRVRRRERLVQALLREVKDQTGLRGQPGYHICTFDQLEDRHYYQPGLQHVFVDNVVKVKSKEVRLNEEAQDYLWATPDEALRFLDIEPNARQTLELYATNTATPGLS